MAPREVRAAAAGAGRGSSGAVAVRRGARASARRASSACGRGDCTAWPPLCNKQTTLEQQGSRAPDPSASPAPIPPSRLPFLSTPTNLVHAAAGSRGGPALWRAAHPAPAPPPPCPPAPPPWRPPPLPPPPRGIWPAGRPPPPAPPARPPPAADLHAAARSPQPGGPPRAAAPPPVRGRRGCRDAGRVVGAVRSGSGALCPCLPAPWCCSQACPVAARRTRSSFPGLLQGPCLLPQSTASSTPRRRPHAPTRTWYCAACPACPASPAAALSSR